MVARLEFSPYFDVIAAKGKEIPGSKSVVWSGRYTPLDHLLYIVDGASGEMLLKYVSPSKN